MIYGQKLTETAIAVTALFFPCSASRFLTRTSKADVEATTRCFFELWRKGLFQHLGAAPPTADLGIKTVVGCPHCNQQLRVPAGKLLDIKCPACRHIFRKYTG